MGQGQGLRRRGARAGAADLHRGHRSVSRPRWSRSRSGRGQAQDRGAARHRLRAGAAAEGLRQHQAEGRRGGVPRHRSAQAPLLARWQYGLGHAVRVHLRREEPLGGGLARVAGLRQVLGAAHARHSCAAIPASRWSSASRARATRRASRCALITERGAWRNDLAPQRARDAGRTAARGSRRCARRGPGEYAAEHAGGRPPAPARTPSSCCAAGGVCQSRAAAPARASCSIRTRTSTAASRPTSICSQRWPTQTGGKVGASVAEIFAARATAASPHAAVAVAGGDRAGLVPARHRRAARAVGAALVRRVGTRGPAGCADPSMLQAGPSAGRGRVLGVTQARCGAASVDRPWVSLRAGILLGYAACLTACPTQVSVLRCRKKARTRSILETCVQTLLSVVVVGFFLGMRHATDADHVVAISTIVVAPAQPARCGRASARCGAWGTRSPSAWSAARSSCSASSISAAHRPWRWSLPSASCWCCWALFTLSAGGPAGARGAWRCSAARGARRAAEAHASGGRRQAAHARPRSTATTCTRTSMATRQDGHGHA